MGTWGVITNAPNPFDAEGRPADDGRQPEEAPRRRGARVLAGARPGELRGPYLRHKLPEASEEILDPHNMVLEVWATAGLFGRRRAARRARARALADAPPGTRTDGRGVRRTPGPKWSPDAAPGSANWLIPWGGRGMGRGRPVGKLNPFQGDLLARWVILGLGWVAGLGLGWLLWRRRPIPAAGAGVGVLAISVNLLAAGGIGIPAVALMLWALLALGLNLRDDLPSGRLRERRGIGRPAMVALVWAGTSGRSGGRSGRSGTRRSSPTAARL